MIGPYKVIRLHHAWSGKSDFSDMGNALCTMLAQYTQITLPVYRECLRLYWRRYQKPFQVWYHVSAHVYCSHRVQKTRKRLKQLTDWGITQLIMERLLSNCIMSKFGPLMNNSKLNEVQCQMLKTGLSHGRDATSFLLPQICLIPSIK